MILKDKYYRVHNYLRISLTDKCNFRCFYCNPSTDSYKFYENENKLSNEEFARIIRIFTNLLGFEKIRLTGGEPFAAKDITKLFEYLNAIKINTPFELSVTTNGSLIAHQLAALKQFGLDRINFSLDSLIRENFRKITGRDGLEDVLNAINQAEYFGFLKNKINMVVMNGINDNEILDFAEFAAETGRHVRFIEYMPFSNNKYDKDLLLTSEITKKRIESRFKLIEIKQINSVAKDYSIYGSIGKIGFISSISEHFCGNCNRLRLSSEGELKLCLFSATNKSLNLRQLIRSGLTDEEISISVSDHIGEKDFQHPPLKELIQLKYNNMISIGG